MNLLDLLWSANGAIVAGVLALIGAIYVYANRHSLFWLTDVAYTFPIVGRLRRFSRDYAQSSYPGWLNVENVLCHDYAKHVSAMSRAEFDNHIEYMRLSYDHGRKPMPFGVLTLMACLVILEGLGFSYLLGSLMAVEGSENTRMMLMVGIVIALAGILLWATHAAGHQLYRTGVLRSCFRQFQTQKSDGFTSAIVNLGDMQSCDSRSPAHVRCANRVTSRPDDRGNYVWVWIAALLIATIAIGSTILRVETLSSVEAEDAKTASVPAAIFGAVAATPAPAKAAGEDAAVAARHDAALAGFAILGVIFVVTQAVGMHIGYRYGFAGKQGDEAWKATGGHAEYGSYWQPIQRRINVANARLNTLQRMLEEGAPHELDFKKSFLDFIRECRERGERYLQEPPRERSFEERAAAQTEQSATRAKGQPDFKVVSENQANYDAKPHGDAPAVA